MRRFEAYVDEVVRPLRASGGRKARMREELLAHLLEAHTQEMQRGVASESACGHVLDRFGTAGVLTARLQASVPTIERALYFPMGVRRSGEGDVRYAARLTLYGLVFLTVLLGITVAITVVLAHAASGSPHRINGRLLLLLGGAYPTVGLVLFAAVSGEIRWRRHLQQGRVRMALLESCLYSVGLGLIPLAAGLGVVYKLPLLRSHVPTIVLGACAFALFLEVIQVADAYRRLRHHPWEELGRDI